MVAGLVGAGFTGSYIFSQTIFSMRANVKSRWHGFIIAGGYRTTTDSVTMPTRHPAVDASRRSNTYYLYLYLLTVSGV